jgi:hypothetical protein
MSSRHLSWALSFWAMIGNLNPIALEAFGGEAVEFLGMISETSFLIC